MYTTAASSFASRSQTPSLARVVSGLTLEKGPEDIAGDGRVLSKPAQGIGVPGGAERNGDAQPMTRVTNDAAQACIHSQQHLKLVSRGVQSEAIDDAEGLPHESLVVGG